MTNKVAHIVILPGACLKSREVKLWLSTISFFFFAVLEDIKGKYALNRDFIVFAMDISNC